ncbi:MAG: preprotein translocase subunit SecA [Clostridiales bacterium]|jgi:preprotein translocase subunit SecA|nr:preprotein translocase subunit SecA [Clostridiales bacterium]
MFKNLIEKIIGTYSKRELKRLYPIVDEIEARGEETERLSDDDLRAKTAEFRRRLVAGDTLDDILPEAYAVVREAARRVLGMKHFRVQLLAGVVLHQGRIAEMKTGEGKTLTATLPVYLNALEGKGVHVVSVNDYLVKRDSEWMGKVYTFLGLTVGLIVHDKDNAARKEAYACDITYGTNNEIGFDYLRDNMVTYKENMVQRGLSYAIVDEVDSILVDEARTPLIISGAGEKSTDLYKKADSFAKRLTAKVLVESDEKQSQEDVAEDYIVDEKANTATITERGIRKAESFFGIENLSDMENITLSHHINQAIKANGTMKRDREYVVKDGEVIIVDEFTGRLMYGRRYSDGLHQAIEAKEGVNVERESKTLATITFQNLFRLYKKLAGMTGTALTEEQEFQEIYKLDVVEVPTNMPMIREDQPDCVLKTEKGKFDVVIEEIVSRHEKGQPVLIGTISIEKSELLSSMLRRRGVRHEVLNAKFHEREAEIIAQAGKYQAVTIATNMAGRGTDIVLGGNAEFLAKQDMRKAGFDEELIAASNSFNETDDPLVLAARERFNELYRQHKTQTDTERQKVIGAGGLCILGTERHESRRIDNQLRGRSGRQGDPGESKFFISLEDDLMRLFGSERMTGIVDALGLREDEPIEHRMLSNAVESAQRRVEGRNFSIRKHVLQYDDVMNQQREVIYAERQRVLNGENLRDSYTKMADGAIDGIIKAHTGNGAFVDDWDLVGMNNYAASLRLPSGLFTVEQAEREEITTEKLKSKALEKIEWLYQEKERELSPEIMREIERVVLLRVVDEKWMDHIDAMDQLRHGISMRAYAQRDPVIEYKFEGFEMFEQMTKSISEDALSLILRAKIQKGQEVKREKVAEPIAASHGDDTPAAPVRRAQKVGRNDPCPCGSGKKYKNCHGAVA